MEFLDYVKKGLIRDNAGQASGWLIVLGHNEYDVPDEPVGDLIRWKVGAFEPADGIPGDVEFLYHVNLQEEYVRYLHLDGGAINRIGLTNLLDNLESYTRQKWIYLKEEKSDEITD